MTKFLKNIVEIKEAINNKRFPVRDISVNFRFGFGFGLHFLPTTDSGEFVSSLPCIPQSCLVLVSKYLFNISLSNIKYQIKRKLCKKH